MSDNIGMNSYLSEAWNASFARIAVRATGCIGPGGARIYPVGTC